MNVTITLSARRECNIISNYTVMSHITINISVEKLSNFILEVKQVNGQSKLPSLSQPHQELLYS